MDDFADLKCYSQDVVCYILTLFSGLHNVI